MKVVLASDGKLGERAFETILRKIPQTEMVFVEERDRAELIEDFEFDPDAVELITNSDLVISYICHPDITFELCSLGKPTIVGYYFGEGLLKQILAVNDEVIMPESMCRLLPTTGINVIDEFTRMFGLPVYDLELESKGGRWYFKKVDSTVESPCGSTQRSLKYLVGEPVNQEIINAYAINIAQECRESVAYQLSKGDSSDTATLNHVIPLLDEIERQAPDLFQENGILHGYAAEKRALVRDIPAFSGKRLK